MSAEAAGNKVTLTVMNPRGEIAPPDTLGINPRLTDLNGKTIALMNNTKRGVDYLHDAFEALLKKRFPAIRVLRTTKPGGSLISSTDEWYEEVAAKADAFIFAMAD